GIIYVNDAPEAIERKVRRAVTDNEATVAYDPKAKPGVSNLLELLGATSGSDPAELAGHYENYGSLKADVVEAVVEMLRPVRQRYAELMDDPAYLDETVQAGADRARHEASQVLDRARSAVGLLSRAPRTRVQPGTTPHPGITPPP
ncbi:MAG: tryptophan--tRNA ligase, partial [Acidimicrobiales bacterium]